MRDPVPSRSPALAALRVAGEVAAVAAILAGAYLVPILLGTLLGY